MFRGEAVDTIPPASPPVPSFGAVRSDALNLREITTDGTMPSARGLGSNLFIRKPFPSMASRGQDKSHNGDAESRSSRRDIIGPATRRRTGESFDFTPLEYADHPQVDNPEISIE